MVGKSCAIILVLLVPTSKGYAASLNCTHSGKNVKAEISNPTSPAVSCDWSCSWLLESNETHSGDSSINVGPKTTMTVYTNTLDSVVASLKSKSLKCK
ncbi:hypothetical protein MicloDRAFT_00045950 [Microvirga lotononidis]|uniref:Secreted protein n=1 Tax=Microvirga lotononidis TaxID=864069 RepID=I4YVM6_9HYPH|nr:hypothetical protein MicloDRAFT_00045950 [Microvirga lotononidis]